jgi:SNF2 family DNA or RNA helicase
MNKALENIESAYKILKDYNGVNPYIIDLKNSVYAYKTIQLNSFQAEFILRNYNKEPKLINKTVKIADWWGESKKEEWNIDFIPQKIAIGWYIGDTTTHYVFFAKYRQSVDAKMMFVPKKAILTDFLSEDWHNLKIDFSKYNKKSGRTLFPHQEEAVKFLVDRKKAILADEMGFGKMEPVSSLIPTPNGFKKMGDLHENDFVFGMDGKPHKILKTFPHKNKEIYRIKFSDGTFFDCGLEHLWLVKKNSWKKNKWRVLSLKEMMEQGLQYGKKRKINNFQIPIAKAVEYEEKKYFIDPYILGICIGDGNMCNSGIKISIPDSEIETSKRITALLKENYKLTINRSASCPRYTIALKYGHINEYNREIKRLHLNIHGNYKFIPEEYKFGSIAQRSELLKGLMDSDGTISKTNNKINYSTNSYRLALDVCELVCSLGGLAHIREYHRVKKYKESIKNIVEYQVSIEIPFNPFKLKHKAIRYNPTFKKYLKRYIVSAELNRKEDAQCLYIDSEDHTYLSGKYYHVTHNTTSSIVAALEGGYKHILVICPASLKENWKKELSVYVNPDEISIVNGSKWDDWKFTIINYDILDNFYTIPTQKVKKKELNIDDNGNVVTEYKEKEIVSKSKKIIDEAMEGSQLFTSNFDLFIIDEAHKLSNTTSGRYKIVSDLVKRSNPKGIFELTGTPITNRPINFFNLLKIIDCPVASDWRTYVERYCDGKSFYKKNERNAYTAIFLKQVHKSSWYDLTYEEKCQLNDILDKKCHKIWKTDGNSHLDELQEVIKPYYLRREKSELKGMVSKTVKFLHYELNDSEKTEYNQVWDDYVKANSGEKSIDELEKYQKLTENTILRQWLAHTMLNRTINLAHKCIDMGHKVIIFCSYDDEINSLRDEFKDISVYHNGKITNKKKEETVEAFQNDPKIKVFIGNIVSSGVGLTLTKADVVIFNSFSWVSGDNSQAEDRIHRLNQTKPCTVYYQTFKDTFYEKMLEKVRGKQDVINNIIISEKNK